MASLEMYWWNDQSNLGDALNPIIVERLFGVRPAWAEVRKATLIGAGSVLSILSRELRAKGPLDHEAHIWGSGYISGEVPPGDSDRVTYHAVRGRRSQDFGGISGDVTIGDPGILSPLLISAPIRKECEIGIVPHFIHKEEPEVLKAASRRPGVKIVDVEAEPLEVVRQIASCEFVFSSSLHGLVVADSFGVPNQWIGFDSPLIGGSWKFRDYYSSFGLELPERLSFEASHVDTAVATELAAGFTERPGVAEMQKSLVQTFPFGRRDRS